MIRLFQIEFQKIWLNKSLRILIFIYFGLIFLFAFLSIYELDLGFKTIKIGEQKFSKFPLIWHFYTYFASILKYFILLLTISTIVNEFNNRTLKQNLIDGLSKKEFILSKLLLIIVLSAISTIFIGFIISISGYINSGNSFDKMDLIDAKYLIAYFFEITAFLSFGMFLSFLLKRSTLVIAFILIWNIIEHIIINPLSRLMNYDLSNLLPFKSISNLIKNPFQRLDIAYITYINDTNIDYSIHFTQIFVVIIWTTIFVYFSFILLKKRDL